MKRKNDIVLTKLSFCIFYMIGLLSVALGCLFLAHFNNYFIFWILWILGIFLIDLSYIK